MHSAARPLTLAAAVLVLCLASPSRAETPVAVVELGLHGEISDALRRVLPERLRRGLTAAGLRVLPDEAVRKALGARTTCADAACWRELSAALGCRFLVGGRVSGLDRSYELDLWLFDAAAGRLAAEAHDRCEICGLEGVASKLDLSASSLRAKLVAVARAPARLAVVSDPPGAMLTLDGNRLGPTPRELELSAGEHEVRAQARGHLTSVRKVRAVAGLQERLELRLLRKPSMGARQLAGWGVLGAGVASLAVAGIFFGLDGRGVDCEGLPAGSECPRVRDSKAAAWAFTAVGAASVITASVLIATGRRQNASPERRVTALPTGTGLVVRARY